MKKSGRARPAITPPLVFGESMPERARPNVAIPACTCPIPLFIVYATVIVLEDGLVHSYDDIYGHDAALERVLARGYPYPG